VERPPEPHRVKESRIQLFEQIWDNYYVPHLRERELTRNEIRIVKGIFIGACIEGERWHRSARELLEAADKKIQPYIKSRRKPDGYTKKCDFCGRARVDSSNQCPGCGAWNKELR
jgi:hypothetical protein